MPLHPYQRLSEAERQLRKAAEDTGDAELVALAERLAAKRKELATAIRKDGER